MPRIEIEYPDDVDATVDRFDLTVEGPNGAVTRRLWFPDVTVTTSEDAVVIESDADTKKVKATMGTFESHVRNMIHGVTDGWEYKLQVHYSHFPMQVNVDGDEVAIENFMGEKAPRRASILGETEVRVEGEAIVLNGPDKEAVGQTAGNIEQLTRVKDKDTRVFQDGVYIVEKPGAGGA